MYFSWIFFFLFFLPFLLHGEEGWNKYQVEEDWAGKSRETQRGKLRAAGMITSPGSPAGPPAARAGCTGDFSAAQHLFSGSWEYCQVIEVLRNSHSFIIPKSIALKSAPS